MIIIYLIKIVVLVVGAVELWTTLFSQEKSLLFPNENEFLKRWTTALFSVDKMVEFLWKSGKTCQVTLLAIRNNYTKIPYKYKK